MSQIILWSVFVLPWLMLIPLDTQRVKRFFPVGIFTVFIITIIFQIAEKWNWWIVTDNLFFLTNILSFNYGLLVVTTIYVFYFTYPFFSLYIIVNLAIDVLQAFVISPFIFEKFYLYELNISRLNLFLIFFFLALVIYPYQKWQETVFDLKTDEVNK